MPTGAVQITPHDVGRRVTTRRRVTGGSATDVVGDLVRWDDEGVLTVRDREDNEHRIAAADLIAARVAYARPVPRRVRELERAAARGWPAVETVAVGDWLVRAADGFTGRANSALAIGDPDMPFADAAEGLRAWYAERGLPARVAVVLPSPEDDWFAALGWSPSQVTVVQTAEVRGVSGAPDVVIEPSPTASWLARYTARGEVTDTGRRVLTGGGTVAFARIGDDPVAIGRGVVADGWLGIAAVEVAPEHRRQGYARAVTRALMSWGTEHGAERAYVQVISGNAAARNLYADLGFRTHHRYRYRTAP